MELKTIDIKGKEYVTVNERIKAFWSLYPSGRIHTELLSMEDGMCVIRAKVYIDKEDERPSPTGTAYERESSSFINKTSYIENCETSAIGRALGILGIGIDTSIASAEEVNNAIEQQNKIDNIKVAALKKAIENANIPDSKVQDILQNFGYKKIEDIQVVDYMNVVNSLKEAK